MKRVKVFEINLWQFVHWSQKIFLIDKWWTFFKANIEVHILCSRQFHQIWLHGRNTTEEKNLYLHLFFTIYFHIVFVFKSTKNRSCFPSSFEKPNFIITFIHFREIPFNLFCLTTSWKCDKLKHNFFLSLTLSWKKKSTKNDT